MTPVRLRSPAQILNNVLVSFENKTEGLRKSYEEKNQQRHSLAKDLLEDDCDDVLIETAIFLHGSKVDERLNNLKEYMDKVDTGPIQKITYKNNS